MKCQNNLDQSTVKNISASDKILTSKSSDYEGYKNQEEQNRCCGKINTVLDYGKYTGKEEILNKELHFYVLILL